MTLMPMAAKIHLRLEFPTGWSRGLDVSSRPGAGRLSLETAGVSIAPMTASPIKIPRRPLVEVQPTTMTKPIASSPPAARPWAFSRCRNCGSTVVDNNGWNDVAKRTETANSASTAMTITEVTTNVVDPGPVMSHAMTRHIADMAKTKIRRFRWASRRGMRVAQIWKGNGNGTEADSEPYLARAESEFLDGNDLKHRAAVDCERCAQQRDQNDEREVAETLRGSERLAGRFVRPLSRHRLDEGRPAAPRATTMTMATPASAGRGGTRIEWRNLIGFAVSTTVRGNGSSWRIQGSKQGSRVVLTESFDGAS